VPVGAGVVTGVVVADEEDDDDDVDVGDGAVEAAEVSVAGSRVTHAGRTIAAAIAVANPSHRR